MLSLTYISSFTDILSKGQLDDLVHRARAKNERLGVTGMMLHSGSRAIQTLEGPEDSVDALFTSIEADARHRDVFVMAREQVERRRFTAWFMGLREISTEEVFGIPGVADYVQTGAIADLTSRRHATLTSHRAFRERVA